MGGRGTWMHVWNLVLLLLLLGCMPTSGDLEVEMAEGTQTVFLHDNVTISCKVPGSPHLDTRIMGILWFWKNELSGSEVTVFEFYGCHRQAFRPGATVPLQSLEWGDASLQLPEVQLWEAGEYRCKLVVTPEKAEGKTRLEVVARPTITLTEGNTLVINNLEKHIICMLDGFYPEAISLKWEKLTPKDLRFREITEGIVTGPTMKNEDGTFNVTSSLELKPTMEDSRTIVQCVVGHKTLNTSQSFNITVLEAGKCPAVHLPMLHFEGMCVGYFLLL